MDCAAEFPTVVSVGFDTDGAYFLLETRGNLNGWDMAEELEFDDVFIQLGPDTRRHDGGLEIRV